jgi:hypothetical protein
VTVRLGKVASRTRAREDADTPDHAIAEQAWRQVSRLASRPKRAGATIARTLEGAVIDPRDLVAQSLLARPAAARPPRRDDPGEAR